MDHNKLAAEIHQDNVNAGWWTRMYPQHPTDFRVNPRNIGELLCLVHSEISEGFEGLKLQLRDDHLIHRSMFEVELADAAIRIYDILGYYAEPVDIRRLSSVFASASEYQLLLEIHLRLSHAMEGFRKNKTAEGLLNLSTALAFIWHLAGNVRGYDLAKIIDEKREYNRNRADHKLENRAKEGGKAF